MKYLALLLIFGFGLSGFGQTIKSLGYNTTNGHVVASTNVTFTNAIKFTSEASNETRYNLGIGVTNSPAFNGITLPASGSLNWFAGIVALGRIQLSNGIHLSTGTNAILSAQTNGLTLLSQSGALMFSTNNTTGAATTRTNLGLGWPALTNTNAATSLLGFTTNGQVVANTGTNPLTFTNRFGQSSTTATNPPEIRLTTKSNNVASWFYYDAFGAGGANTTNDVDWSVLWLGNNHVPSSSGLDFGRFDQSIGAISLTMENMYYAGSLPSPSHVGEFYINISDYTTNGSGTTRAMFVVGSQTNSARGQISFSYPIYLNYNQEAVDWLSTGSGLGGLNIGTTNSFQLATFYNTGTAHGGAARISIGAPANAMGIEAGPNYGYIRQFSAGRTAFRISTNGVIYGTTNNSDTAQAPIHLANNTRIDGAISFNTTSNAANTRANLGFSTNLNTLWEATTASNARSAVNVAPAPIFKALTNDFSITNQTNMTVVDGLTITTEAGKNYTCELLPILSANSGNTIMQIVGSNATVYGYWIGQAVSVFSTNSLTNEFSVAITSTRSFVQKFHVISGTNSGTISFQFRNATNNNTNTIQVGSYMMAQEVTPTP